jgi:hypothetical protein
VAAALLSIALLGHTASIFSEHKLSTAEQARSAALLASEQFMERLRSDDDFAGLYARLEELDLQAQQPGGKVHLEDNRRAFTPQTYYPDFVTPRGLSGFYVLVDVPSAPVPGSLTGERVLREDVPQQRFGLPSDLDGSGAIDDKPHDADYRALPVVVTFRWTALDEAPSEFHVSTWLWGYR